MSGSGNRKGTGMVNDHSPFPSSHWDWNNPAVWALSSLVGFPLGFLLQACSLVSQIFLPLHSGFLAGLLVLMFIVCHDSEVLNIIERNHGLWLA